MRSSNRLGRVAHREKGTCTSNGTIRLQEFESRVLGGSKNRLLEPNVFEEFVIEYHSELRRIKDGQADVHSKIERQYASVLAKNRPCR
jgi:hypothetical protein